MTRRGAALALALLPALAGWLPSAPAAAAAGVYLQPQEFIGSAFEGHPPKPETLWPSPALQKRIVAALGHPYKQLRIRYWREQQRTAWVLDEELQAHRLTVGGIEGDGHIPVGWVRLTDDITRVLAELEAIELRLARVHAQHDREGDDALAALRGHVEALEEVQS